MQQEDSAGVNSDPAFMGHFPAVTICDSVEMKTGPTLNDCSSVMVNQDHYSSMDYDNRLDD